MIDDVAEDEPRVSLQREIEELHKCIGSLDNMLDVLYEALTPALVTGPEGDGPNGPPDETDSPLVNEVRLCIRRLGRIHGGVAGVCHRLQI